MGRRRLVTQQPCRPSHPHQGHSSPNALDYGSLSQDQRLATRKISSKHPGDPKRIFPLTEMVDAGWGILGIHTT